MKAFDFVKSNYLTDKVKKQISAPKEKRTFYNRFRLFVNGYDTITRAELDLIEAAYSEQDKNIRAAIKEAKTRIKN